jgi:hypothetical protein
LIDVHATEDYGAVMCHGFARFGLVYAVAFALSACGSSQDANRTAAANPATQPQEPAPLASVDQIVPLEPRGDATQDAVASPDTSNARAPDPTRPIEHEHARTIAEHVPGVRSAIWMDSDNLLVMVDGPRYRNMDIIDRICQGLDPLGDTLAVVVNVEDVTAKNADDAESISRNCQLPEGERAANQPKRQVDALDPELRKAFREQQAKNP